MARIYEQPSFGSQYEGYARSQQYNPVQAFDNSDQIRQAGQQKLEDIKTLSRAAARQYELDSTILQKEKERGNMLYEMQRTQTNNTFQAIRGLLSLSSSAMEAYQQMEAQREQREDEDQLLESIGWGESADVPESPEQAAESLQGEAAINAEAQGSAVVASELRQSPDLNSQSAAHVLQQTTTYNALKGVQGNAYAAAGAHGLFLAEAMRNLPPDRMPKTPAEAQVMLRELNRTFLRDTGMMGADRKSLLRVARQMAGNTQNALVQLVSTAIKTEQESNLTEAKGFVSNLVDSGADAQQIWDEGSKRYAYGNVGYSGHSGASNQAALENILQEAAENGNVELIRQLRTVQQVPGQKGTELERKYDHVFDKYEKAARQGAIQDYNLLQAEQQVEMKKSLEFFYNDPSPENRQQAIAILRGIGTEDALKEADRLSQHGLGYDPQKKFELLELQQRGIEIPEDTLKQLLDDGTISAEEYKRFAKDGPTKTALKAVDDFIKEIDAGLKTSMYGTVPKDSLTPQVQAELQIRHQAMVEELRRLVGAEVKLNPGIVNDKAELARIVEAKTQYLLQQPQYKLQKNPQSGVSFAGELKSDARLARITVAPGVQDFSKFNAEDLFGKLKFPKSEMNPSADRFIPIDVLRADVKKILAGQNPSNNTRLLAKNLGLSSAALVDAQLGVNGLPSLSTLRQGENGASGLTSNLRDIPNMQTGMKVLKQMGFPTKGAAYLAGNIQQESTWNGQRSWGEVAGDGSDRNGGLISWMDDAQRNHFRLRAVEKHFGKPISQISEGEQLQYMVIEMKRRNPEAYRTFMDPNASDAALRKASYQYWGYGHEGSRFSYAQQLLSYTKASGSRAGTVRGPGGYQGSSNVVSAGIRDYKGRELKLSPNAANAWRQMVAAGMPLRGQDITSGHRDAAEYQRLRAAGYGAASNSAHNHGEGIDVHGPMGEWLKKHGHKYGWRLVDYEGSHGGHFEYRG